MSRIKIKKSCWTEKKDGIYTHFPLHVELSESVIKKLVIDLKYIGWDGMIHSNKDRSSDFLFVAKSLHSILFVCLNILCSGYCLLLQLKLRLQSQHIGNDDKLLTEVINWLKSLVADFFDTGLKKLAQWHKKIHESL